MKRQEIVDEAHRLLANRPKWELRARSETSMDCYGLVVLVRNKFGLNSEDGYQYGFYPEHDKALPIARKMFNQVHPPLKIGSVVVFQYGGYPWHCGITTLDSYNRFSVVHSSAMTRKVMEEPFEGELAHHFRAAFDFLEIED